MQKGTVGDGPKESEHPAGLVNGLKGLPVLLQEA